MQLGRWLGIAHEVGTAMTYWILKENGQVICLSTVRLLPKEEWTNETEKTAQINFNEAIKIKYGTYDPELLEVFKSEEIINTSSLDEETNDEQDTETTGQRRKKQRVQVEVPDDIVRGPELFQNAETFYPELLAKSEMMMGPMGPMWAVHIRIQYLILEYLPFASPMVRRKTLRLTC
jgi:hypothetical protein